MTPDYSLTKFYNKCSEVLQKQYGFELDFVKHLPNDLARLGSINVPVQVIPMPIGTWPRNPKLSTIGSHFGELFMNFAMAMAARPFVEYGMDDMEIGEMLNSVRNGLNDKRVHAYLPLHFVWAQKPPS